jgi:hypothetical protein
VKTVFLFIFLSKSFEYPQVASEVALKSEFEKRLGDGNVFVTLSWLLGLSVDSPKVRPTL